MLKKVICFLLFVCLSFCICGCKDSKKDDKKGVDVEYYANLGQIPECAYFLGKKSDDIISELKKANKKNTSDTEGDEDAQENSYYSVNEKDGETVISVDNCDYICDSKKNCVEKIVCFGDSYGFENGTVSIEIKNSLSSYGFEAEEKSVTEAQQNLFNIGSDSTVLEYEFKKATVVFAFQDNLLLGSAIFR